MIVFVRTTDGGLDTVGGQVMAADGLLDAAQPSPAFLADSVGAKLHQRLTGPLPRVESRLRALMPRRHPRCSSGIVLPLWATGRLPEGADAAPFGALERLAGFLGDQTLVAEAHAEFRRAVAADPVSHQMVSDLARLRALAADELDRASSVDERPPLVALLPERFAIEELRHAIRQVLQRSEPDHETSSNFRRRIADLIHSGVLVPSGELVEPSGKGRPAQLYSFDRAGWRRWLAESAHAMRLREHHATSIRASRPSPKGSDLERQAYENVVDWTPRGSAPEAPPARGEQVHEMLAKQIEPARRASASESDSRHFHARSERPGDPQRDRVERLERLVQSLAGRIDELSKRQTEPPARPPGSSSNP